MGPAVEAAPRPENMCWRICKGRVRIGDGGAVRVDFDGGGVIGELDGDGVIREFGGDVEVAGDLVGEAPEFEAAVLLAEDGPVFAGDGERQVRLRALRDGDVAGGEREGFRRPPLGVCAERARSATR